MEEEAATRPEELMNSYLKLRTATRKIANGLGFLALLWSTVVLLGGFVSVLRVKEFWVLTGMSFLMACRLLDLVDKEVITGDILFGSEKIDTIVSLYLEELRSILGVLERFRRIGVPRDDYLDGLRRVAIFTLIPKLFLGPVLAALQFVPLVSLGISVWRLKRRDYGDADGNIANIAKLSAALDIFYALVLLMSVFVAYWLLLVAQSHQSVYLVASLTNEQRGYEKWIPKLVQMYYKETKRKYNKDGELPNKWTLIKYGVGMLQSASGDDDQHLWGARVLDKLCDDKDIISVRQELLSTSRSSIPNLIGMICQRGTADDNIIEKRERAARILARLASDLHITHFPGTPQCICSLLSSCNQFCEPHVTCCPSSEVIKPDEKSRSLEIRPNHQHDAHTLVPIQDQTDHGQAQVDGSSSSSGLAQIKQTTFLEYYQQHNKDYFSTKERQQHDEDIKEWWRYTYRSRGAKELGSQGLWILERLTQDEENCTEIRKHQRLLSKITSPLSSPDFLSNVRDDTKVVPMLGQSLTVVSRLLTSHGDGATRLRQELASNTEATSKLMAILDTDSECARQLHQQALEILTELAFDDSFKNLEFNKLFKALLRILLEKEASNTTVEEVTIDEVEEADSRDKATRLMRRKAGEALARLLPVGAARERNVNAAHILSNKEAIKLLTKVLNQILSSKMGTTRDAVKTAVNRSVTGMEALLTKVFHQKIGKNVCAKAVTKTKNQVAEEVINQILCSEVGTISYATKSAFTRNENLPTKVVDEILSSKMETTVVGILRPLIQGIENQSEERKFLSAMLSVAMVICNENVISKEEFARATPEDAALVKKLKEILKVNKHNTTECLRVVKLTCQVVIAMIQVNPSCIAHFKEHSFKEELTEALDTMLGVDDCMLFTGNDHEVIKPARSLASLVKEAKQLINTTLEHGD